MRGADALNRAPRGSDVQSSVVSEVSNLDIISRSIRPPTEVCKILGPVCKQAPLSSIRMLTSKAGNLLGCVHLES
jgi:hypothetical protein